MSDIVAAQHRAMPYTRLVDYGMDPADARDLLDQTAAGAPWPTVAHRLGKAQVQRAQEARSRSHVATAADAFAAAAAAFAFEQMPYEADDDDKRLAYRRHIDAVSNLCELSGGRLERVEIDVAGGVLSGWLSKPPDSIGTVVVWGGLSGWGAAYLPIAAAYARRGLACLLAEGPGQGMPRLEHRIYVDRDVVDGFARFVDHVESDARLPGGIAIQGNSFGGLYAAHLASRDDRVRACIVNGAPPRPEVPEFRTARAQMAAAMGTDDTSAIASTLAGLAFDPAVHRIGCPLLVLAGDRDPLAPTEVQRPFASAGNPDITTLRTWPDGEHTLYNRAVERNAMAGDWLVEALRRG